jgi:AAA+ superfamily predicted ATPase
VTPDLQAFAPELARLDVLVEAEVRRVRARYELSADEFHGLYITDQYVEALLRQRRGEAADDVPTGVSDAREADTGSRWRQLAVALELDDDERDILLVSLAPDLDPKYEVLYAYLNDDVARRWPTTELLVRLLGQSAEHRLAVRERLLPNAKLMASGLLEVTPAHREHPRGRRALRVAPPLADWLRGLPYVDERLQGVARFGAFEVTLPDASLPAAVRLPFNALAHQLAARVWLPPIVVSGATPMEAALAAENLFARARRLALIVDLAAFRIGSPAEAIAAVELAQYVLGVGVVLTPLDALFDPDGRVAESCAVAIRRLARRATALIFASSTASRLSEVLGDVLSIPLAWPELNAVERAAAWRAALAGPPGTPIFKPPAALLAALSDRFALGADQILRASAGALQAASLEGASSPTSAHVFAAARTVSTDGAGGTTRTVTSQFTWDDLVLPGDVKTRLADIVHAIEQRSRVLDDWGFGARVGSSRGVRVMFAGPSGTGKTMAAAIVARTLQLDLHRIELGTVVSKYLGDTEKNFDRAFAAARRANAVLFIDEADAVLGKRSQVKDAHDRYANVEIAYLLQKMEDHDGIVITATNLAQNIDDAFSRRMHFVIEFPMPDAVSRERLWRGLMPGGAPLDADVDFTFLARQFEMAGGDIRNIVLDAAYGAAQGDTPITMGHLLRAIARQYAKRGRVPTPADFREHSALLTAVVDAPVN